MLYYAIDKTLIRMIREYLEQGFDLQGITHQNDMENDMEKDSFGKHRVIEGFVSVLCAVNFE